MKYAPPSTIGEPSYVIRAPSTIGKPSYVMCGPLTKENLVM